MFDNSTPVLLAKPKLSNDWLDCSVGEPHLIKNNLVKIFKLPQEIVVPNLKIDDLSYPDHVGYNKLVKLLEEKHGAPVVITNGAKQALGATFYALNKLNKTNYSMRIPYWALIPPLARQHGLTFIENSQIFDSYLCLGPNNPDGHVLKDVELKSLQDSYKEKNIAFIHDAAYYTHSYLPQDYNLINAGDVQIYSISKMFGLSGLRIGYCVCNDLNFYKLIQEYMETMTVGVSLLPQVWLYNLLHNYQPNTKRLLKEFEQKNYSELQENKKLCLEINQEILEITSDIVETPGMFGWFKVGAKADLTKSKVNLLDGKYFGVPGYVRMNLAFEKNTLKEIIRRLNSAF